MRTMMSPSTRAAVRVKLSRATVSRPKRGDEGGALVGGVRRRDHRGGQKRESDNGEGSLSGAARVLGVRKASGSR